jgi:hypothetical protein
MTDRNMQAKEQKASRQRAAIMLDMKDRESYIARTAPSVTLSGIKAEYTGRVTICPPGKYNGFQSRVSKVGSGSMMPRSTGAAGRALRTAIQNQKIFEIRAARAASPTF